MANSEADPETDPANGPDGGVDADDPPPKCGVPLKTGDGYCSIRVQNGVCRTHGDKETRQEILRQADDDSVDPADIPVVDGVGSGNPGADVARRNGRQAEGGPPGNKKAMTHGIYAVGNDPAGLLDYLEENEPDNYDWVEWKFSGYIDDAPFGPGHPKADQLLQVVLYEYAAWQAHGIQIRGNILMEQPVKDDETGEVFERLEENPVNIPLDRIRRTIARCLKTLGVMDDPMSDRAGATSDWAEAARQIADLDDTDDVNTDEETDQADTPNQN